jgi:hypothetical protein
MSDRAPAPAPVSSPPLVRPYPRLGLAIVCLLHAFPLGWAALVLPMRASSWLALTLGLLALLHAATALVALLDNERALRLCWRALAIYSLLLLLSVSIVVGSAASYLSALYQDIGIAVSAALVGVWGLLVLLTVPVSAWGLARTVSFRGPARSQAALGSGLLAIAVLTLFGLSHSAARAAPIEGAGALSQATVAALTRVATRASAGQAGRPLGSLPALPAFCDQPVERRATLLLSTTGRDGTPFTRCLQTETHSQLPAALERLLHEQVLAGSALKLDWVTAVQRVHRIHPLLDALALRPALDGVCNDKACLAPWQLVSLGAFTQFHPLPAVRDASFGASLEQLATSLHSPSPSRDPLLRIETRSWLVHDSKVVPYLRMRPGALPGDLPAREQAVQQAAEHIMAAQRADGAFRYLLDPFTGVSQDRLNLPRQAGTTLALCELVPGERSQSVAERALRQLASFAQHSGELSAISESNVEAELGPLALPLSAFITCRARIGAQNDALIGRMTRLLLAMQRPNGSFFPKYALAEQLPAGTHEPLYAGGQAVLALVLMEQASRATSSPHWPAHTVLHDAVERAMTYYARDYWPRPLRSLFYIEENWHCLAARAALPVHRHDGYEALCLDYVAFKSRLILHDDEGVSAEHAGGYGLSDMFPPHSTATAGFGEALAAALAVKHARGLELRADQALLQEVLAFVLRQQWTRDNCFACAAGLEAAGAFSESESSPAIRIDYVQHAMAALGHGSAALALTRAPAHHGEGPGRPVEARPRARGQR